MPQEPVSPGLDLLQGHTAGSAPHGGQIFHVADEGKPVHQAIDSTCGHIAPLAAAAGIDHLDVPVPIGGNSPCPAVAELYASLIGVQHIDPFLRAGQGKILDPVPEDMTADDLMLLRFQAYPVGIALLQRKDLFVREVIPLIHPYLTHLDRRVQ